MVVDVEASIITLDGNNIRHTGLYIEGGFKITAPIDQVNGGNLSAPGHLQAIGFAGDYMETWNTQAVFNLEERSGKAFNLVGLDVGSYFSGNNGLAAWTFSGFTGETEVYSLVNSEYLGNQVLNWNELTRFSITSSRGSAASAFDNIEVFVPQKLVPPINVNEPQTALLIALTLMGFGLSYKNNDRT